MENLYQETRRDRWVRLPYALLTVMFIAGGISYFFDIYRPTPLPTVAQSDQRAAEYVQRRIAEHNAQIKQAPPQNQVVTGATAVSEAKTPINDKSTSTPKKKQDTDITISTRNYHTRVWVT